ncbi:MAG TPA: ImmA/IrrE family metallo-endopeptidase, partial [Chloroflexota bacterium]|nr:ImmA/IrrE family metallo-endopeptidase [Chloroflexota bacterium]
MFRDVLENDIGLRVFYVDLPSNYSEIYVYSDQLGGCLAVNRHHPMEWRCWSLVHSLGHFLAHRQAEWLREGAGGADEQPITPK